MLGHTHVYTASVTAPTCTEGGYTTYTCPCGDSYVADEVAALGHNYDTRVTAPTCTEGGYTTYTCTACGDSYVADEVAAFGHSFENGVCQHCGEIGAVEYGVNTFVVETVHDESGAMYIRVSVKNVDLAGVLFTLNCGQYKLQCEIVGYPENADAFGKDGVIHYVFSGGENTVVGDQMLLEVRCYVTDFSGSPVELCVQQIYRFADGGELEIPPYTVIIAQ